VRGRGGLQWEWIVDVRDLEELLVDLLQGVDALFELDVVGWELSLLATGC